MWRKQSDAIDVGSQTVLVIEAFQRGSPQKA
ncbi:protein of unknown function (plasmid) [Caballeronia sp. S22]